MEQRHALWQTLGQELRRRLAQKPEVLGDAGGAVGPQNDASFEG